MFAATAKPEVDGLSDQIGSSSDMLTEAEVHDMVGDVWSDLGGAEGRP